MIDKISKALTQRLSSLQQPVITDYELYSTVFNLFKAKKFSDMPVNNKKSPQIAVKYLQKNVIEPIIDLGIITPLPHFPNQRVFQIISKQQDAEDIACTVDPFAYISHLNAMAYHGLTNRIPKIIYLSSPAPVDWMVFARKKMNNDLGKYYKEYCDYSLPKLARLNFSMIYNNKIFRYSSIHHGAFKHIEGRMLRVSTIGRTFLDMLREPDYCGSMYHVIDVFKNYGAQYSNLIIDEIDRHGTNIEKSRAGYLLEEILNINDAKINEWAKKVQRGGSRRLDPKQAYSEKYSERWSLSLNMD